MQNVPGGGWRVLLPFGSCLFRHFIFKIAFPCECIFTMPLVCVMLLGCPWAVCWLGASVPTWLYAGGGLCDRLWRQWVPRECDGNGQAFAQRVSPGLAPDLSTLQPAGTVSQHLGLWASSSLPAKPSVDPLLLNFHTLFVDF